MHIELHLICSVVCCTFPCHASLNRTCIILVCASCHVHVMVVYYVVCSFSVLLIRASSDNVAFVRILLTTYVCLLHGLVLLPCGISGKMTTPRNHFYLCLLDARSIAMSMLRYLPHALSCLPYCHVKPLTHLFLVDRCLAKLPLLLSPSYSVVSCR